MKIQCSDKKTYELIDNSEKLGCLTYNGWFSFKANAMVGKDNYEIKPTGIFITAISVTKNGAEVASMKMTWKGNIIISFQNGQEFILKTTGIFLNRKFVIENQDQQKLMLLDPRFNWTKFNYNYSISYDNKPKDILLVLLATYSANYYIATTTGE